MVGCVGVELWGGSWSTKRGKILDFIREAKRETFLEGKEYAVIKRKNGKRYLVSGDRLSLDLVNDGKGQSKQYVFHNGLRTTIYRGTDSSADVTIQAND